MKLPFKTILLYITCIVFTVAIGLILFRSDAEGYFRQGQYFIYKFIWFEFILTCAFWGGVYSPFRKISTEKFGGAYPAIGAAIFNASIFSAFLILISSYVEDKYLGIFIALQFLVILIVIIKVFIMSHASDLQKMGMEEIRYDIKKPQELVAQLTICERQPELEQKTLKLIKKVKDDIQYSLPKVGNIAKSVQYEQVVVHCNKIYNLMMSGSRDDLNAILNNLNNSLNVLILSLKK
jgi:hypothetical protein